MDSLSYKTISVNDASVNKEWYIIDAETMILGRLASKVAMVIRGKHKPSFTPHVDCGDNVIIINAEKIRLTGNKWNKKEYIYHTGYPGGQRSLSPRQMMQKGGHRMVEKAVKGMLPKNRLGRKMFKNLYVYTGPEHPHAAQQPKELKF
ncbi:MAG: 50S ribosomal protein L13 [Cyclobacteriaceae bacterium]